MKNNNTLDMFYGFWKYLGVTAIFLIGLALFWWGIDIFMNDFIRIQFALGPIGSMVLMPLAVGLALIIMSMIEFLRIIRE